nr:YirE [Bacillus subtilis]
MDYRRDGQNDQHQTEPSHTEQQNTENQKLIGHSEQELLDAPVSYEAGRQETASALEMEKQETAVKKEKKRRAAWLSPILGGIIGGGSCLASRLICRQTKIRRPKPLPQINRCSLIILQRRR